ncbi:stomatin/prohibitin-family membrane protease [Cutibacterium acnes JCM 18916]|nr:stomatin/prohibitin-family membrane protease [Cutibacterium acnes JCM 18916]
MPQFIPSLVIIVLLVVVLSSSIKIIHQQKIGLVERLGKFNRRLNPGPICLFRSSIECSITSTCVSRLSLSHRRGSSPRTTSWSTLTR